jgi:anti-sigma regulatory factor (Ser/Thr protein kinase)
MAYKDLSLIFRCDGSAPKLARAALMDTGLSHGLREDAQLLASELVTNAVVHSGCTEDDPIEFRAVFKESHLVLSVHDPGHADASPRVSPDREAGDGGIGLQLVGQLTRRWGYYRTNVNVVWAELAL